MQAKRTGLRFSQQVTHFLYTLPKANGECSASTYNILMPNGGRKAENKKCQQCAMLQHLMSNQKTSHVCETLLYSLPVRAISDQIMHCGSVGGSAHFPSKSTSLYSLIEGCSLKAGCMMLLQLSATEPLHLFWNCVQSAPPEPKHITYIKMNGRTFSAMPNLI